MRLAPLLGLAALLATAACAPESHPLPDTQRDTDGDGVVDAVDCAPKDPAARWERTLFADLDGDGHGAGPETPVCAGEAVPAGWATVGDDCDDADRDAFQLWSGYADDDGDGAGAGPWLTALCGGSSPPRPLSPVAGDCAPDDPQRWQELPHLFVDGDGDGITVPREGVVCAGADLPPGYATVASGVDCDDANPTVSLTVTGYADVDHDGLGAGAAVTFCTAGELPAGYAAEDGDCAPDDPAARVDVAYGYRDVDHDGRTVAQAGTLCVLGSLPAGYLTTASGNDCDDADPDVWELRSGVPDTDRDGYGAGEAVSVCSGAALPAGWVAPSGTTDCEPDDPGRWRTWAYGYRDADGDLRTVASAGTLCIGSAPPAGYATSPSGNDCDDANPLVWATVVGYADADLDGVGAGASIGSCTDGTLPAGEVATGSDCAPDDRTRWQLLPYALADADGDGHTAPVAPGQTCAGATLPDPYRASAAGQDCDDADPSIYRAIVRYPDADGDGVGATPREIFCVAGSEPAGYSKLGWDVDDHDPAAQWDGSDADLLLDVL